MRPWVLLTIITASAIFVAVLIMATRAHEETKLPAPVQAEAAIETVRRPEDATYVIEGRSITLKNGTAMDSAGGNATVKIVQIPFRADVDRSGNEDAVVLLERRAGAQGVRSYIAVALRRGDAFVGTNAVLLGDHIRLVSTDFEEWIIVQKYIDRGIEKTLRLKVSNSGTLSSGGSNDTIRGAYAEPD